MGLAVLAGKPSRIREVVRLANHDFRTNLASRSGGAAILSLLYASGYLLSAAKMRFLGLPHAGSVYTRDRFELLDSAIDSAPEQGLYLEFGVYYGESINHIAKRSKREVFGFDSFEGLPRTWTPRHPAGDFSTEGKMPEVRTGVKLIPGWFDQTLPEFLKAHQDETVAFVHVDCDLYSSTLTVLKCLGPRITKGTVIVFDEFCGAIPDDEARAWREFCKAERITFNWLGCSAYGSVAVKVGPRG